MAGAFAAPPGGARSSRPWMTSVGVVSCPATAVFQP